MVDPQPAPWRRRMSGAGAHLPVESAVVASRFDKPPAPDLQVRHEQVRLTLRENGY